MVSADLVDSPGAASPRRAGVHHHPWEVLSFPAISEADEVQAIETTWGRQCFTRRLSEALHPAREPLAVLENIRRTIGEETPRVMAALNPAHASRIFVAARRDSE